MGDHFTGVGCCLWIVFAGDISFRVVLTNVFYPPPNSSMLTVAFIHRCLGPLRSRSAPWLLCHRNKSFLLWDMRERVYWVERGNEEMFFKTLGWTGRFGMLQALIASWAQDGHPENGVKEGYAGSHVQMWELDHEEGWAPKNWCFRTVVLEKTLESPLDIKEIKPVNPKGNQLWIFIGRTDVEV